MARLEDITVGCSVTGIIGSNTVEIVAVKWFGTAAMEVTYKNSLDKQAISSFSGTKKNP